MTDSSSNILVALGSNLPNDLGSSEVILSWAVHALSLLDPDLKAACLYSSKPVGPVDQPDYFNSAVSLQSNLSPLQLLRYFKKIEQLAQRRSLRHWGERTLDLDIIFYQQQQINLPELTVPHKEWSSRSFVIQPLRDLGVPLSFDARLDHFLDSAPIKLIDTENWPKSWQQFDTAYAEEHFRQALQEVISS